jgi:hypothetical protein
LHVTVPDGENESLLVVIVGLATTHHPKKLSRLTSFKRVSLPVLKQEIELEFQVLDSGMVELKL